MERLGIFAFYDKDGIVDTYIETLLDEIKIVVSRLVIIVNGKIDKNSELILRRYSSEVYIRENKGFDAAAYKEAIFSYLANEHWNQLDELVLFNDTFYGPFFPLKELWDKMDTVEKDFWGITRFPSKVVKGKWIQSHIQSYFLVIENSILQSDYFLEFWNDISLKENDVYHVIDQFEVRLTTYFESKGFKGVARMDLEQLDFGEICPFSAHSYELITNKISPFLKKKSMTLDNSEDLENGLKAYSYVSELDYDIKQISNNMYRLSKSKSGSAANFELVRDFYYTHLKIYIYGRGAYGKAMENYFSFKGWKFEGFIVSDFIEKNSDEKVYHFSDINLGSKDGIILALNKRFMLEVLEWLAKEIEPEQLLLPVYP